MERHRRYFIWSVLAGAGGVLGVQSCRLMAKEAFPHVYFVGCDAYWPLLALFAAGLTAAAFFCFCKKAAPPLVFGPLAALALVYTVLLVLPFFRYRFSGTAAEAVRWRTSEEAVLQKAVLGNLRDLSPHIFTQEEFDGLEDLLEQTPMTSQLPWGVIRGQPADFIDGYWLILTYYAPEKRAEYWEITLAVLPGSPAVTARFQHVNGYEERTETPELLYFTGLPGLGRLVEAYQDQMTPFR